MPSHYSPMRSSIYSQLVKILPQCPASTIRMVAHYWHWGASKETSSSVEIEKNFQSFMKHNQRLILLKLWILSFHQMVDISWPQLIKQKTNKLI